MCYVFIGNNDYILKGVELIEENFKNDLDNYFTDINDKYIRNIFIYLTEYEEGNDIPIDKLDANKPRNF